MFKMGSDMDKMACSGWVRESGGTFDRCLSSAQPRFFGDIAVTLCGAHWTAFEEGLYGEVISRHETALSGLIDDQFQVRLAVLDAMSALNKVRGVAVESTQRVGGRPDREGFVYFVSCQQYIKIGHSVDPEKRLKSLKMSGNGTKAPRGIDLWEAELLHTAPGGQSEEKKLHEQFAHLRADGEWFHAAPELLQHIESISAAA